MKKKTVFMLGTLLLCSGYAFAVSMDDQESVNIEKQEVKKEVGNKICPTEGAKIGSMGEGVQVEHEGKIYNLCCESCIKAFQEDPEKYHKIADKEVGLEDEKNEDNVHENGDGHDHQEHK